MLRVGLLGCGRIASLFHGPLFAARDDVEITAHTRSGRVARLRMGSAELSGHALRQVLGGRAIRSAMFEVRREGDRIRFLGSGSGHGVGLSQWGARELARKGKDYRAILAHYYPQTRLARSPSPAGRSARP